MRVAHIIMAHKNPEQLSMLIASLEHPLFDVYLHIDAKESLDTFNGLHKHKNLTFIKKRTKCNWGGYSLLKGILNCTEEVLSTSIKYDIINLLSGQDYPLRPAREIHKYFEDHPNKIFLSFESPGGSWWKEASQRFEMYHLTDFNFPGKYLFQWLLNKTLPVRKFPMQMSLYGGNKGCWWTITAQSAEYVIQELKRNGSLKNFLKLCWGTDEFVIPTLIMNSHFKDQVINDNLRYIDWSEGNANPKTLTKNDYDTVTNSGMLFARKFDTNQDSDIINKIDETLKMNSSE